MRCHGIVLGIHVQHRTITPKSLLCSIKKQFDLCMHNACLLSVVSFMPTCLHEQYTVFRTAFLCFSCMSISSCIFVLGTVLMNWAYLLLIKWVSTLTELAKSDFVLYTAGLMLDKENRQWREAGLSAKWGAVARTRKRNIINTVQTNCTPYGVPSHFLHSRGNMQYAHHWSSVTHRSYTQDHTLSHKMHT